MNRTAAALVLCSACAAWAQPQTTSFRVFSQPPGARFAVDGTIYTTAASFTWPAGSQHTVRFVQDLLPTPIPIINADPTARTLSSVQLSPDGGVVYTFSGWTDNQGLLLPTSDPVQVVTASSSVTSLQMNVGVAYRILLNFFDSPPASVPASCGAPGAVPPTELRIGLIYISGTCYWNNAIVYQQANTVLQLNAFPFPGFVFDGWSSNIGGPVDAFLRNYVLTGPLTLAPRFEPAKRVRFQTNPAGLQVLIDRTVSPTWDYDDPGAPCPHQPGVPATVPSIFQTLCVGDFDFVPGSTHLVGAPSPQQDLKGKYWVFDSWGSGQGENASYIADQVTAASDTVTVKFAPGAQASFVPIPTGLKLKIDGRDNWPSYNFVWALGSTHQVSAPAEQFDSKGRRYTFRSWSNAAAAAQNVTVDQAAVDSGMRMIASYDVLSRVVVQSSPPGVTVKVDGADCGTPCTLDRVSGSQIHVTAPASVALGNGARMDFANWSDNAAADHVYSINSDTQTLTVNYRTSYQLSAASDPVGGVSFRFDPQSPDLFYSDGAQVTVTAEAKPGFKFRRWGGDLSGTFGSGVVTMSGSPHAVVALLDRVPFIAPAGVRNAAGNAPGNTVAPGSIVSIFGESLAPHLEVGRVNPLAQAIAGVTVTVGDRLLPLLYVSPEQINAQIPSDLPEGDYTLQVHAAGQPDVSADFSVSRNAPGLFGRPVDDKQYVLALHEDGTPVTEESPARQGETITVFGVGFGPYAKPVVDGFPSPDPAPALSDPADVLLGDAAMAPSWSGAAAGFTGVAVVKLAITPDMPSASAVELRIRVNGKVSNKVLLPLE
jgi:uncharacterized protein (TIGR03437 family)